MQARVLKLHHSIVKKGPEKDCLLSRLSLSLQYCLPAGKTGDALLNTQTEHARCLSRRLEGI